MNFRMNVGDGMKMRFTQNVGDLKAGYKYGDYSRISAYYGKYTGVHTGSKSPTLSRGGKSFGNK